MLLLTGAEGVSHSYVKQDHVAIAASMVMSSDDSEWLDVFMPRISTVAQPSYEMGSQAAGLLLKRIKTPGRRYAKIVLPPELRIR